MEELLRILQRCRSTGKHSHWKVWLRLNLSLFLLRGWWEDLPQSDQSCWDTGDSWLDPAPLVWSLSPGCLARYLSHSDSALWNTRKLPFSRCDCSRVPVDSWLTLFSQPGGFFHPLCVCRFLSPSSPLLSLFFFFFGSLIFLSPWTNAAVIRRILRTTAFF